MSTNASSSSSSSSEEHQILCTENPCRYELCSQICQKRMLERVISSMTRDLEKQVNRVIRAKMNEKLQMLIKTRDIAQPYPSSVVEICCTYIRHSEKKLKQEEKNNDPQMRIMKQKRKIDFNTFQLNLVQSEIAALQNRAKRLHLQLEEDKKELTRLSSS
jgi:hypothetical protein